MSEVLRFKFIPQPHWGWGYMTLTLRGRSLRMACDVPEFQTYGKPEQIK